MSPQQKTIGHAEITEGTPTKRAEGTPTPGVMRRKKERQGGIGFNRSSTDDDWEDLRGRAH